MSRTLVIAEIGSCHDGHLSRAFELIDVAAAAGADVVKAQFWSSAERLAVRRRAPDYLKIYRRYRVPLAWLPQFQERAASHGMEFMATTYIPEDIQTVEPFVSRFKISSFEARDDDFVRAHRNPSQKPLVISIGMMSPGDVQHLRDVLFEAGFGDRWGMFDDARVTVMHCVSAYPTPLDAINLGVLRWAYLGETTKHCGLTVRGFSDHSGMVELGGLAVAAGATTIEAHLKLSDTDVRNPDAGPHALDPAEFRDYVAFIRLVETLMGDGLKRVMPVEGAMAKYQVRA